MNSYKGWSLIMLCSLALWLGACGQSNPATTTPSVVFTPTPGQTALTIITATISTANGQNIPIKMELARTPQEQETGLMGRPNVPDGSGMLFVFSQPGIVGFWMKDTPLPLSIAFIDNNGKILDIQDMQPMSEVVHAPNQLYQYALEVGQGWFGRANVGIGDKLLLKLP